MSGSFRFGTPSWNLNGQEIWKIVKGALIAGAGAAIPVIAQALGALDDGTATGAALAAFCAIGINFIRKFITDNTLPA